MKIEQRPVFIAEDGTVFSVRNDCVKYEEEQNKKEESTTYWRVNYKPDLTEGRGYYGCMLVKLYGTKYDSEAQLLMEDWCFRTYGRKAAFVQGVAVMSNWALHKIDKEKFLNPSTTARVGDYDYGSKKINLIIGGKELGLIEDVAK